MQWRLFTSRAWATTTTLSVAIQVEEVEEPDRVAELVGVADEEQQLVGDLVDSCP